MEFDDGPEADASTEQMMSPGWEYVTVFNLGGARSGNGAGGGVFLKIGDVQELAD
jgi:hypothetical protein